MCDLRPPPYKVINIKTKEEHRPEYRGGYPCSEDVPNPIEGIYSLGTSGVGYYYFDGQDWCYCYENEKYKFMFEECYLSFSNYNPPHTGYNSTPVSG